MVSPGRCYCRILTTLRDFWTQGRRGCLGRRAAFGGAAVGAGGEGAAEGRPGPHHSARRGAPGARGRRRISQPDYGVAVRYQRGEHGKCKKANCPTWDKMRSRFLSEVFVFFLFTRHLFLPMILTAIAAHSEPSTSCP